MEKELFFEMDELEKLFAKEELFISLDIFDKSCNNKINIIENKTVRLIHFPNTLQEIGKMYSCEKKIRKYIDKGISCEFTLKIKLEKKGVFEYSSSFQSI